MRAAQRQALIIDGVRSPRGRGKPTGALHGLHPQELLGEVLNALAERTAIDRQDVEDAIVGNGNSVGDHASCVGRLSMLAAGRPATIIERI